MKQIVSKTSRQRSRYSQTLEGLSLMTSQINSDTLTLSMAEKTSVTSPGRTSPIRVMDATWTCCSCHVTNSRPMRTTQMTTYTMTQIVVRPLTISLRLSEKVFWIWTQQTHCRSRPWLDQTGVVMSARTQALKYSLPVRKLMTSILLFLISLIVFDLSMNNFFVS